METILMSPETVQEKLCIGKNATYSLFKRPDFPTLKIGKRLYIRPESLDNWMKKQEKIEGDAIEYFHLLQGSGAITEAEAEGLTLDDMATLLRAVRSGTMTRDEVISHVKRQK